MNRLVYGGLGVVAACAAVLSFVSLTSLAGRCGFDPRLAWLLPLVVDAGAAVATVIWLRTTSRFARAQALVLLAVSVIGNGIDHYLSAYNLTPAWPLVVAVAAIAPATLGSTIHLARQGLAPAQPVSVVPTTESLVAEMALLPEPVIPEDPADAFDATVESPWTVDEAAEWGLAELRAGRTAGWKRISAQTGLSEHHAKKAAAQAKDLLERPVRVVAR